MYCLRCTRKLLDRLHAPVADVAPAATTRLGDWYATALLWRPQLALLVNERTLLPVLMPLAPAATLAARFPAALSAILRACGADEAFIDAEIAAMQAPVFAHTASRRILGSMNDFIRMAKYAEREAGSEDLLTISLELAETPCGPIGYESPRRLIRELVGSARQ